MTGLAKVQPNALAVSNQKRLVELFLSGRSDDTRRAYAADLRAFLAYRPAATIDAAVKSFIQLSHGQANAVALNWRSHMVDELKLAPATVNRRLAALRSVVKLARTVGLIPWTLDVDGIKNDGVKDTRGPGQHGYLALLDALDRDSKPRAMRDRAIVQLLYLHALRRVEVVRLDVADIRDGRAFIQGKGRRRKEPVTLSATVRLALDRWLFHRGDWPGPMFSPVTKDGKPKRGKRLTARSINLIVGRVGASAGITAKPHGLRHAAITESLEEFKGNVRKVRKFSRHKSIETLMIYDDNREDTAHEVSEAISARADAAQKVTPLAAKSLRPRKQGSWKEGSAVVEGYIDEGAIFDDNATDGIGL